jgi:hypothetical protein
LTGDVRDGYTVDRAGQGRAKADNYSSVIEEEQDRERQGRPGQKCGPRQGRAGQGWMLKGT